MLKALRDYFSFIGVINTQYSDLVNEYTKTGDKDNCRELTEKAITALDNLNEKIQNEISPYLFGFSLNIGEKINNIFEDYYDAVTNIFSKYSQPDMNHTKLSSIQRDFSKETKDIVSMIYKVVKENCPK
jgi:formyltetrahydrofolate synthetase